MENKNQVLAKLIELESTNIDEAWDYFNENTEAVTALKSDPDEMTRMIIYRLHYKLHLWINQPEEAMVVFEQAVKTSSLIVDRRASLYDWTYQVYTEAVRDEFADVIETIETMAPKQPELKNLVSKTRAEIEKADLEAKILPKDEFMHDCFLNAAHDPYKIFKKISKKEKLKNNLEAEAIKHYCIRVILRDISEHGESNMEDYGDGEISVSDFKKIDKEQTSLLNKLLKSEGKSPNFWVYKKIQSIKDV